VSETGLPTGPVRWTLQVRDVAFDVPVKLGAFSAP
jgi:hypothetical protein